MKLSRVVIAAILITTACSAAKPSVSSSPSPSPSQAADAVIPGYFVFQRNMTAVQHLGARIEKLRFNDDLKSLTLADKMLDPADAIFNFVDGHPTVRAGAESLNYVASLWNLLLTINGDITVKHETARFYREVIRLYPDSKVAVDAQAWIDSNT